MLEAEEEKTEEVDEEEENEEDKIRRRTSEKMRRKNVTYVLAYGKLAISSFFWFFFRMRKI